MCCLIKTETVTIFIVPFSTLFNYYIYFIYLFYLFIYYICHFTINLDLIIKVKIRNMARKPKRNQGGLYEVRFPHKSEIINHTNIAEQSVQLGVTQE